MEISKLGKEFIAPFIKKSNLVGKLFYNFTSYTRTIEKLSKKYKIKNIYFSKEESKRNKAFLLGSDEIEFGPFDNKEFMLISFFHEIGHLKISQDFIKNSNYSTMLIELGAWAIGLALAVEDGILFSDDAISWALDQIKTYKNHDEREYKNWEKDIKPKLFINK